MKEALAIQIFEQFSKAQKILIALREHFTPDGFSSALALYHFLKKMNKDLEIVCSGESVENLKFLPGVENFKQEPSEYDSLVVLVDTQKKQLGELSYQTEENKLKIFLKSKTGKFVPEDVSFTQDEFPVDLIVTIEAQTLNDLGKAFETHPDLFYSVPKINFDHSIENENFANINVVDLTSTSIAEILSGLFQKYEQQFIDADIATCLLAGIITKTESFQHIQTTPKAFNYASKLIDLGGRQQEVVRHIYKTKSLQLLKLWGRSLTFLKILENYFCAYAILYPRDLENISSSENDLIQTVKELLRDLQNYPLVGIIAETRPNRTVCTFAFSKNSEKKDILEVFDFGIKESIKMPSEGYSLVQYVLEGQGAAEIETKFIDKLKKTTKTI